jgi:enoyl-CoA hydratase/carnithine racemase
MTTGTPRTPGSDIALYSVEDGVAWLTMNRPEAHNALSKDLRDGIRDGFTRFRDDDEARVLVLTGAGDKAFSAGGDLKEMAETQLKVPPPDFLPYLNRSFPLDKPVIAAVNGVAYGGGFLLAQMCDLCVAAEHARFGITEARWGRGAPWGAPLPWLIPPRVAMELLVTAEPISAQRAYEVGLVNKVVPGPELQAAAQQMAATIAANAPLSVRAGKAMVYAAAEVGWTAALAEGDRLYEPAYLSEDAQEGPRAFREKRRPQWKGR